MDALAGKLFGRYRLDSLLGQGRLAAVYRAADPFGAEPVAVKVFDAALTADEAFGEPFLRELRGLTRLQHPGLLSVREVGEREDLIYLVMPLVTGGTLRDRLDTPLDPAETSILLRPVAEALDYLHAQGVVHGAVCPANVLFTEDGAPLLADGGIAPAVDRAASRARGEGGASGTSEIAVASLSGSGNDLSLAARADLASLAALLREALTGSPTDADPAPGTLSPDVEAVLHRARGEDPAGHYPSAVALFDALAIALPGGAAAGQPFLPGEPVASSGGEPPTDWPAPWTEPATPPPPAPSAAALPSAAPPVPAGPAEPATTSPAQHPVAAGTAATAVAGRSPVTAPVPAGAAEPTARPGSAARWERRYSTKYDLGQLLRKAGPILLIVGIFFLWGGDFGNLLWLVPLVAIGLGIYWYIAPYVEVVCGPNGFAVTTGTRWHGGHTERYTWSDVRETRYFEETRTDSKGRRRTTYHFLVHTRRGDAFDLTTDPPTYAHIIEVFNEMTPQLPYVWLPFTAVAGDRVLQKRGAYYKVAREGSEAEG